MAKTIAVIANCQVASYARCVSAFAPDAEILPLPLADAKSAGDFETMARRAAEADVVFAQPLEAARYGPLVTEALRARCRTLRLVPRIAFWGFHPDAVHVVRDGALVWSPTAPFQSRIAVAAFLAGATAERALSLYNALIFTRLGYFSAFDNATAQLSAHLESIGLDLAAHMPGWLAQGAFMHTPNHPKLGMIATLTLAAAQGAGLEFDPQAPIEALADPLARAANWPVYPEIARRLGVEADPLFRRNARDGGEGLELADFVGQSFELFQSVDRGVLEAALTPRVRKVFDELAL